MQEDEGQSVDSGRVMRNVLTGIAIVYVVVSLYFIFSMRSRIASLEESQKAARTELARVDKGLTGTESNLKASTQALAERLGTTEKEITDRAAQLQRQWRAAEQRLAAESAQHKEALYKVTGDVAGVKTELGGAKTDIASTKSDLEATKAKLESTIGDLKIQSGLVARTQGDLEYLKHRGDRDIYEFALTRNNRTPVSTISLELKKADPKRSRFTLNVLADDRTIEKKDRTLYEPMQFYSGRERQLFEVVVLSVEKNKVTGYLSAPKAQAAPVSQQ